MTATRILLLSLSCCFLAVASVAQAQDTKKVAPLTKPKVIFFDVNETLLDLQVMRKSVGEALGGREDLLPLWFSTMLYYSLVDTTTERYHDFAEIGTAALMMVAETNGIKVTNEDAKKAIVIPMGNLPAHPDVKEGLQALKERGYTLVSLTNSSNKGVETQFKNAGLTQYFDQRLSIEDIKVYKPALESYKWAIRRMGIKPEEAMMVAAHGWDIAGAKAAGMQAVFVTRPSAALYPLGIAPDRQVGGIKELAEMLKSVE